MNQNDTNRIAPWSTDFYPVLLLFATPTAAGNLPAQRTRIDYQPTPWFNLVGTQVILLVFPRRHRPEIPADVRKSARM
jgi:hypothetical protein